MRYIALLRGINVGTSGRIRMEELRRLLEEAGLTNVSTYIQSGNVLFDSPLSEDIVRKMIERALESGANITTTAVLRTADELLELIQHCPFSESELVRAAQANTTGECFHVGFLTQEPDQQALEALRAVKSCDDRFVVFHRTIYLLLGQSIRTSPLAIRLQRLFPGVTVRNWNTVLKLNDLARVSSGAER